MKNQLLLVVMFLPLFFTNAQSADNYDKDWKKVYDFELEQLPKSALTQVDRIYAKAKKDNNAPQLVKTLLYKSKFAILLEEDASLKTIKLIQAELAQAQFPVKNILESILAELYWQYFEQNRWRFYNRTRSQEKTDPTDFRTWDLHTIFKEVYCHHQNALINATALQKENLQAFDAILTTANNAKQYRPTVFDFLAKRALNFYKNEEQRLTKPAYKFELEDPNLLSDNQTFTAVKLIAKDSLSQHLAALKLYQELTLFHTQDKDPTALMEMSLARLTFVKKHAIFKDKDKLYEAALKKLQQTYSQHEAATEASYLLAKLYDEQAGQYQPKGATKHQFKRKAALDICNKAIANFPKARGSQKCASLKAAITHKTVQLKAEKYIPIDKPSRLLVSHKNLDKLFFKAYKLNKKQAANLRDIHNDSLRLNFITKLEMTQQWESALTNEADYQLHTTEVLLPKLAQGRYLILAATTKDVTTADSYGYTNLQATNLVLVNEHSQGENRYQVIDRNTGKPITGAQVNLRSDQRRRKLNKDFTTNKEGRFAFTSDQYYYQVQATVKTPNDKAVFGDLYMDRPYKNSGTRQDKEITINPFLFTDRSIYRPGQTVYFKTIALKKQGDQTSLLTREYVDIILKDPNGQKIKTLSLKLNDYGSAAGTFILPTTGLTGQYTITIAENKEHHSAFYKGNPHYDGFGYGSTQSISVEEYKRPRFETSFEAITATYRLNDSITITGKAHAYSGSTITNAKVSYRVLRTAQLPRWRQWWNPWPTTAETEISHGETTTDTAGNYAIDFKALPDAAISKEDQPIFTYRITAAITDINGETRSAETLVNVGYHALSAQIELAQQIDKTKKDHNLSIQTKNLNGQMVPAKGIIKIYKLLAPEQPLRQRPWETPDYQNFTKAAFKKLFPNDAYAEAETNPAKWEKAAAVYTTNFNTAKTEPIPLGNINKWASGHYVAVLETQDQFGQTVKDELRFEVFSQEDKTVADHSLFTINTNKNSYAPGETVQINLGSAAKDLTVVVAVEKGHKKVADHIVHLSNEIKTVNIPVTSEDLGGFAITYHFSAFNSFVANRLPISVDYPTEKLSIETLSFRDKLKPGSTQNWSFKIKNDKGNKVAAELLAGMYDASLDQFKPHQWYFDPFNRPTYYGSGISHANHSFGISGFNMVNKHQPRPMFTVQKYDQLNWFGFSLIRPQQKQQQYLNNLRCAKLQDRIVFSQDNSKEKGYYYGQVLDVTGEPLPGVNIMFAGTTLGTQTDFDGLFSIKADQGEQLTFSYIGFKTLHINLTAQNTLKIYLCEDSAALDEVVVVGYGTQKRSRKVGAMAVADAPMDAEMDRGIAEEMEGKVAGVSLAESPITDSINNNQETNSKPAPLNQIQARTNLRETAFFFPQLRTDKKGQVSFEFTMPEALTRWKLQLLAHTTGLQSATKTLSTVTQKELMVIPNAPRFLREGDRISFSSKIANLTDNTLNGMAQIQLTDAISGKDITTKLLVNDNNSATLPIMIAPKGNTQVNWSLKIPDGLQAVQYKIVATAGNFSDGEQSALPVLSNRMLVTETLPLWVKSGQEKTFTLNKLRNNNSNTLKHHKLTVELTSNPVWLAVQALPYLMEYPYQCAEQTFSRYYANALATHIANSNPKIKSVFEQWRSADALVSKLEQNQELKSLIIQETPWLRDAQTESEQKKRIALLFDLNTMEAELNTARNQLKQMQMPSGGFPWFKGSRHANRYITQHIVAGFGHLKQLKILQNPDRQTQQMLQKALGFLDKEITADYQNLQKQADRIQASAKNKVEGQSLAQQYLAKNHLGHYQLHYLYMRSFYAAIKPNSKSQKAINYYLEQAAKFWTESSLYNKGLIALTQHRQGNSALAKTIMASLKENSTTNEELGMYWKENSNSWYWYKAPIETHALLIEAFATIENNHNTLDQLKTWLLKNKQTNKWQTTKATTAAIYALLLQGTDWVSNTDFATLTIGDQKIDPTQLEHTKIEAGTGYFKTSYNKEDISTDKATITLKKEGEGIAWGALYWQYFEDLDKITNAKTPLQLSKKLFLKRNTDLGEELVAIKEGTTLQLGDLIRVRITLKADRALEFVHMKDMRASGLEPTNVLSGYKWQDGLGYYQSTRDASTNFFFDHLRPGVYVFEYDLRVNNKGHFSNGITTIQSMYAPEYSSHSEGVSIKIGE